MPSKIELKVREMDDKSRTVAEGARNISHTLKIPSSTSEKYISAKRHGFDTCKEYEDDLAMKRGYRSQVDYVTVREIIRSKLKPLEELGIMVLPFIPEEMHLQSDDHTQTIQDEDLVQRLLSAPILTEREKTVIELYYFQCKTFEEIKIEIPNMPGFDTLSRERVHQIKNDALKKIRYYAENHGMSSSFI